MWCALYRVAWVFGPAVAGPIEDVTPTYLTRGVLEILRECDYLANQILAENGMVLCIVPPGHITLIASTRGL